MAKGDHLYIQYPAFQHHAIDLGDGTVIEYGGKGTDQMCVRQAALEDFLARGPCFVRTYAPGTALPRNETVRLARKRLREQRYNLFNNNCEHLAFWCKTGYHHSPQADTLRTAIKAGAVLGLIALVANAA